LIEKDGSFKVTNKNVNKMGPINLLIEDENLYNAWENNRRSTIEDFEGK